MSFLINRFEQESRLRSGMSHIYIYITHPTMQDGVSKNTLIFTQLQCEPPMRRPLSWNSSPLEVADSLPPSKK